FEAKRVARVGQCVCPPRARGFGLYAEVDGTEARNRLRRAGDDGRLGRPILGQRETALASVACGELAFGTRWRGACTLPVADVPGSSVALLRTAFPVAPVQFAAEVIALGHAVPRVAKTG